MKNLVSKRELAKQIGVSEVTIRRAIKNGRIFGDAIVGNKIDLDIAVKQFYKNQDITKKRNIKSSNIIPITEILGEDYEEELSVTSKSSYSDLESELNRQRARKEKALADRAEIQVKILSGELVEIDKVNIAVFEVFRVLRDHWLRFPSRVSANLSAELGVDKKELENALYDAIVDHMKDFTQMHFEVPDIKKKIE